MKALIYIGITIGGGLGGWLGSLIDHSGFGFWSVIGSTVGGLLGLWAGYKLGSNM